MNFIEEFIARGYFHQSTDLDAIKKLLNSNTVSAYIGFDATADSLHVGSLMQIMILRMLQKYNHRPIIIIGGATTKIGDPSGKDEARQVLSDETIEKNKNGIKQVIAKFVKFGSTDSDGVMLDNNEWLSKLNYINLLRDYGRHFSVNRMLSFDNVKLRLEREQNLSFLEFNYMILQAIDFVELHKNYNCKIQIGGSDQWGNIVNGIELNRRMGGGSDLYGLTTPLITTSSGVKMGKTQNGAVWLSEDKLSSYDYYQFWRNTEDNDVIKFLKMFTDLPLEEISEYENLTGKEINIAKKRLAFEATKLCHGEERAKLAEQTAMQVFEQGLISNDLPRYEVNRDYIARGTPIYKLFVDAGLVSSGGEAKRLIIAHGAKINDNIVADPMQNISEHHIIDNIIKLSAGKKKHVIVSII